MLDPPRNGKRQRGAYRWISLMQVEIDEELQERLSQRAERFGFNSTEDYVITVLQTVVDELEETGTSDDIQDRLEDLGYLE